MRITSILLAPFFLTYQKISKPKEYEVRFDFNMDKAYCNISYVERQNILEHDPLLMYSFTAYLSEYLHVCDKPQKQPMIELLSSFTKIKSWDYESMTNLMSETESMVYETLDDADKKDLAKLQSRDSHLGVFNQGQLPFLLSDEPIKPSMRYQFFIFKRNGQFRTRLTISAGLDKELLPRTLILFLQYVVYNLSDEKNTKVLKNRIATTLEQFEP